MRPPRVPPGIIFLDEERLKLSRKEVWQKLGDPKEELRVNVFVRGASRKYVPERESNDPVRVLCGNSLENFRSMSTEAEKALEDFLREVFRWARETRFCKMAKSSSRISAHEKRLKSPTSQTNFNFQSSLPPRPR